MRERTYIERSNVSWYSVSLPFDLLESFKKDVYVRAWDASRKVWWFPEPFLDLVLAMLRAADPSNRVLQGMLLARGELAQLEQDQKSPLKDRKAKLSTAYEVLGVRVDAPDIVVDAAYRALISARPPGNFPTFADTVNAAFHAIRVARQRPSNTLT